MRKNHVVLTKSFNLPWEVEAEFDSIKEATAYLKEFRELFHEVVIVKKEEVQWYLNNKINDPTMWDPKIEDFDDGEEIY